MAKVTQLIQTPSLTEQARQMILVVISLVEKQEAIPDAYPDRLAVVSMLAWETLSLIFLTGVEVVRGSFADFEL
ncbi:MULTISPECIES: hypothetical protein [Pantoea]|uniref:hypothetical protein n=1 Tax=Pantoea TaxID=53335 RepID=UPI000BB589E9|nr:MULTISPECIES: hypothetical protein [Pantoea]PNK64940.1 hypothetical protein A6J33_020145 [Pantoea sp. FDAARGOS_194]